MSIVVIYVVMKIRIYVLDMYMKKFNLDEEPILPMGSAEDAIEMLMIAIDTNKKLKFDWDNLEPKEYKL